MRGRQLCRYCCLLLLWFAFARLIPGAAEKTAAPAPEGETIIVSGTVYRREAKKTSQSIYLKNVSVYSNTAGSLPKTRNQKNIKLIAYLKKSANIKIGATVLVEGVCDYPRPRRNPGAFDAESYYRAMGVTMFLKSASVLHADDAVYPVRNAIANIRDLFKTGLEKAGEDADAGILSAMLLGDKSMLDTEIKDLYQDAGIIHLLAISGLHISLTGMALYRLLRRMGVSFALTGMLCASLMAGYACMTCYPISAVRAVLMFCLFLLSQVKGRTYDLPTGLAAAGAVILIAHESALEQAAFLLSFGAVGGVILANTWESRALKGTALGINLAVQIVTLPLLAVFYFQIPVYALLLNLCILWMMPFVLGFGIAGMSAALLSESLGTFLMAPAHYLLLAMEMICRQARLLPFSTLVTGKPAMGKVAAYYSSLAAFLFLCEMMRKKLENIQFFHKIIKIDLIKLSFALILLSGVLSGNRSRTFAMTFLDVGQGDGCCIENAGHSVWMIDGGSSSERDISGYCLEPFLKSKGIDRIDYWMVSHGDSDHVSGLLEELQTYERGMDGDNAAGLTIGCILLPDIGRTSEEIVKICLLAQKQDIPVRFLGAGDSVTDGLLKLRVLAPDRGISYEDINESSMVVETVYGGFAALLTGDVTGTGEEQLLKDHLLRDVDVLKVAHHGSRYSTSAEFLKETAPELAVISCGRNNRYGHPHEELLARLKKAGCRTVRTDRQGAIEIRVAADRITARAQIETGEEGD